MQFQPASSAILIRQGRVLLVRRRNPPSADLYAFPGGRAEPGETEAETALRELREETGLGARAPELFATYELVNGDDGPHFRLSVFLVEGEGDGEGEAADDAADMGWFEAQEALSLPAPVSVTECIERLIAEGRL